MLQWNDNNPDSSAEEKVIQTIPAKEEGDLKLINPVVKCEMGNAETFDFSIEGGTKYYDSFHQMQTYIGVKYDGDYIFSGRVLTVDTTMYGTRRIRCEGALTYFGDTPVQGEEESKRKKQYIVDYMRTLLDSHNYFVGNGPRYMTLSETPGNYSGNKTVKDQEVLDKTQRAFGSDSNTDTKSVLEDLRSYHGGYFRTRVAPGGIRNGSYLDWMDNYFSPVEPTEPTIELGKNIIDFSSVTEVDNIFTILIPVGKKTVKSTKSTSNSTSTHSLYLTDYLLPIRNNEASEGRDTHAMARAYVSVPTIARSDIYDPNSPYYAKLSFARTDLNKGYHTIDEYANATNLFGWIYKTVTFDTAETQEELFKQAMEWIKTNYSGSVTKFTIKAVDMHQIGENTRKIMVGDLVKIVYPVNNEKGVLEKKTITLTCLSVSYDLYNPENNTYTFGKPANALTKTYGVTKKGKSVDKVGNQETSKDDAGSKKPSEWLTKAKSWLRNHRLYYTGRQYNRYPYIDDYGDNYQNGVYFIRSYGYGYNLRKAIPNQYVPGVGTVSWILDKNDPANHIVDGEIHFDDYDDIAENDIVNSGLIPYVYYQYGVDLQNINGVKVPAEAYGNDGKKYTYNIVSKTDLTKSAIPIGDTPQLVARIFDNETRQEIENGMLKKTFFYKRDNNTGVKITAKVENDEKGNTTTYKNNGTSENPIYQETLKSDAEKGDYHYLQKGTTNVVKSLQDLDDTVGDNTKGLVKTLTDQGISVGLLNNAVNIIGATDITPEMSEMIEYLATKGITVNTLTNTVNVIGNTIGDNTRGMIKDIADNAEAIEEGITVLSQAINIIGATDITPQMADMIVELRKKGLDVNTLTANVNVIGNKVGNETAGLIKDMADAQTSVNLLTASINIIGADKVTDETRAKIAELKAAGLTVTALTSDVTVVEGRLDGHDAKFDNLTAEWVGAQIADIDLVRVQSLIVDKSYGYITSPYYYVGMLGNAYSLTGKAIGSASLNLVGNTYYLHFYNCDDDELEITKNNKMSFSRATTLSLAWSGGIGTVTASPQGETYKFSFEQGTITDSTKSKNISMTEVHYVGNNEYRTTNAFSVYVDCTNIYNNGWNAARKRVNDNIPYSDVGHNTNSSISVIVPNADGSSSNTTYTYTMSLTSHTAPGSSAYKCVELKTSGNVVARLDINSEWVAQYNSVGIKSITAPKRTSSYSWDPTITATADNGNSGTRKIWIEKIVYDSKDYVVLKWESSSGDIFGGISAESIYTKGVNSVEVTSLTAPIMDNDEIGDPKITALASNGEKKTRTVWLERSTYKASGETRDCVNARWDSGSGSIIGRIRTDQIYSAGYTDGYDAKHNLYISGKANWTPLSSPQTIDPGGDIELWPSFEKTNGGHDGPVDPFVVKASAPSISVSAESSWYATGSESDAKSAAAQAMKTSANNLSVKKLSINPSRWAWCKAYYSGDTAYILLGF